MFAAWQNPDILCDVNADGKVTALDALVILNAYSEQDEGDRSPLKPRPSDSASPFFDVSGDGWLTPLDALQVINAINRNPQDPTVVASVVTEHDPNGNGFVLTSNIELQGQTSPYARVTLSAAEVSLQQEPIAPVGDDQVVIADVKGHFRFSLDLAPGRNRISLSVRDELGAHAHVEHEVVLGNVITEWNSAVLEIVRDWTTAADDPLPGRIVPSAPPVVAQNLAMIHVAMFDAINAISGTHSPYVPSESPSTEFSSRESFSTEHSSPDVKPNPVAAAASAAFEVAKLLYPDARELAVWTATLSESLRGVPEGLGKELGIAIGQRVATAILNDRRSDGSHALPVYQSGSEPGQWNRTAPNFFPPLLPHWGTVRPFTVGDVKTYRPAPPPSLNSVEYAESVDEVMRLGRVDSTERTTDQAEIAMFWLDGAGTATPPGHWNRIASEFVTATEQSLLESARTLALLNLALVDAGIASWDAKYEYDLWRPIDAIRRGNEDGNSATSADPTWLPFVLTPNFPSYTSGHSTFSGAASAVLTHLFGDNMAFASRSDHLAGQAHKPLSQTIVRQFDSFDHAAHEAGKSRIYGGIHFEFDSSAGLEAGRQIGEAVVANWLTPVG